MSKLNRPVWRRRLYVQLSFGFLFLLSFCCWVFIVAITFGILRSYEHSLQVEHRPLASKIAARLQPSLDPTVDVQAIFKQAEQLTDYTPWAELFFIGQDGRPIDLYGKQVLHSSYTSIDVDVIEAHLKDTSWNPKRRLIKHPTAAGETVFSAAPLTILGEQAYLLITLKRHQFSPVESLFHVDALAWNSLWMAILLTALAAATGLFLFALLTKRFYELLRVVRAFQRGDYSQRSRIKSRNELGELSQAVNTMADTIEQNIRELEQKDELRRRLVANISHDLRAPIAGVVTLADALQEHGATLNQEQLQERFAGLVSSGLAITRLVDELFELSKLEAKEVRPDFEQLDAAELVQSAKARFLGQAARKGLALEVEAPGSLLEIRGDRALLDRVFDNLIANAIRHTPKGGAVTLKAAQSENGSRIVRFAVSDSGEGIPESEIENVLKPHYSRGNTKGMGLGLAIVVQILQLHDSAVEISSSSSGSEFSFPIAAYEPDASKR